MSSSVSVDTQALQRVQPVPGQAGLAVPWLTVLPMVVVMAYGDGFWATSLRGAVGAVARTGEPFAAWWRQSTLT
ncbi:MAG TPA: hypothetical protein VFJ94_02090, partial [Intrasporangium sp.]|uniref:hypothetical protein n=1 Tax=Intrasporangium sp. TaxID=1925024 RepID=UPI002D793F15